MINFNLDEKTDIQFIAWQLVIFAAVCWTAVEAPLSFVFHFDVKTSSAIFDGIISLVFITDIFLNLTDFYKLKDTHSSLPTAWQKQKTPYLSSIWFPIDLVCAIPFDLMSYSFDFAGLPIFGLLRLLRVVRMLKIFSLYNSMSLLPQGYKLGLIFSGVLIIIHWISCAWMYLNPFEAGLDNYTIYNKSLYWTITTLTTIGYGDITPTTNVGRIFTMFIMIIGVGTYGVVIGNVSRLIIQADRFKEAKKEKINELGLFMKHYHIPVSLQRQVFSFYHHLLNERMSDKDNAIINDLPHALQDELQIYMKIKLIDNVHIFRESPTACLKLIAQSLKQCYYSPGDYIIKNGDMGEKMFIISHGEVEVMAAEKVVATLKDGQFFGEIALLEKTERTADVISKSYCDLYTLHKDDFLEIVEKFPALHEKFKEIYTKRKSDNKKIAKAS